MSVNSQERVAPAWSDAELSANPHDHAHKPEKVRRMFAAIAEAYELNNRVHSFGRDRVWRAHAVRSAGPRAGESALDVACGTGDLTRALAASGVSRAVGLDFTPEMLAIARAKPRATGPAPEGAVLEYIEGDAMALPFAAGSFDIVTIAFGIRNVANPARALAEFARVLRPGGRVVILEFGTPRFAPVRWMNDLYTSVIMPRTATWISGDRSGAYHYLPRSVRTFMEREQMTSAMQAAGFGSCSYRALTFGVCLCYRGVKPS